MEIFLHIWANNLLPLSVMIAIGIVLQRSFSLDIKTLSKLNFYLFSPAIIFNLLYETEVSWAVIGFVLLFFFLFMMLQYGVTEIVIRLRGFEGGKRAAMRNSVLFYNSANYGIPLNQLAFAGNPQTLAIQVLIMMMQSLIPNTYGIYSVNSHRKNTSFIWKTIASMPVIYVIPIAFAMRGLNVELPVFVQTPIDYLANAFLGTAIITLGVQLGSMKWRISRPLFVDIGLSCLLRLGAGPALAALVVWGMNALGMHISPLMASALIVSSAVPTSLSSVLLAVEFDNEPEFSSQVVFASTLLSIFSVTLVISLLHI
ncbi:AEC family transporter [Paenibacillus sp. GCM10012307]|uniref:AEC family transporter n=1 Tax=Paenibacillus roseus TaxID=2798579 RepID=A0A934J8C7_9BACL|nr:AEC family transporter [Paenibacillus roseus]MBJ6362302.1 AEC family transporter [Paenibacillus roseus]